MEDSSRFQEPSEEQVKQLSMVGREMQGVDIHRSIAALTQTGTYVAQDSARKSGDAPNQVYYFNGTGLAYTMQVRTCTALALYHQPTQRAYLSHAEDATSPRVIAAYLQKYLQDIEQAGHDPFSNKTHMMVYCSENTYEETNEGEETSLHAVLSALVGMIPDRNHQEQHDRVLHFLVTSLRYRLVSDEDYIFVGGGQGPMLALTDQNLILYLIALYPQMSASVQRDAFRDRLRLLLPPADTEDKLRALAVMPNDVWGKIKQLKTNGARFQDEELLKYLTAFQI